MSTKIWVRAAVAILLVSTGSVLERAAIAQCELPKIIPNDPERGDQFGTSVALSDRFLLVGAPFDDDASPADAFCDSGSVYVFEKSDSGTPADPTDDTWIQTAKFTGSDTVCDDEFGAQIDISGNVAVVGARKADDACPANPFCDSGSVYVFRFNQGSWVQEAKLVAADAAELDRFGTDVAIEGDTIVVGAPGRDDFGSGSGTAYVFRETGGMWTQEAKLDPGDLATFDSFGQHVDVWEDRVVAAAPLHQGPEGRGVAYVFHRVGVAWSLEAQLSAGPLIEQEFISDISADGPVVALSIYTNTTGPLQNRNAPFAVGSDAASGASVVVFRNGASGWFTEANLQPAGLLFRAGFSVAVDANRLLFGNPEDAASLTSTVFLYEHNGLGWVLRSRLSAEPAVRPSVFGFSVDSFGSDIVTGAKFESPGFPEESTFVFAGAVFAFTRDATATCVPIPAASWLGLVFLGVGISLAARFVLRRSGRKQISTPLVVMLAFLAASPSTKGEPLPRSVPAKPASVTQSIEPSELQIKFVDSLRVRADAGGLTSLVAGDLSNVESVAALHGLTFEALIPMSEVEVDAILMRAQTRSNTLQPDLLSTMRVSCPTCDMEVAANALLSLNGIEGVEFVGSNITPAGLCQSPEETCCDISPQTGNCRPLQLYHKKNPGLDMFYAWTQGAFGQGQRAYPGKIGSLARVASIGYTFCQLAAWSGGSLLQKESADEMCHRYPKFDRQAL